MSRMETKKKHFKFFKKRCRHWLEHFGLNRYEVYFEHKKCNNVAEIYYNIAGGIATIRLNTNPVGISPSRGELDKTAFHEVLELLLARLNVLAKCRYVCESEIDTEIHTIIRTFESAYSKGRW